MIRIVVLFGAASGMALATLVATLPALAEAGRSGIDRLPAAAVPTDGPPALRAGGTE